MASSETCPCQTNMRITDWQPQIIQNQTNVCPYAFAKIKRPLEENQSLSVPQTCEKGKHGLAPSPPRPAPPVHAENGKALKTSWARSVGCWKRIQSKMGRRTLGPRPSSVEQQAKPWPAIAQKLRGRREYDFTARLKAVRQSNNGGDGYCRAKVA